MASTVVDESLVAYCGLYCGACSAYKKGKCPGCRETQKKAACKIRRCNVDAGYESCAACEQVSDVATCRRLNRPMFRIFGYVMNYDMILGVKLLRKIGRQAYAEQLAQSGLMWVKRR